MPEKRVCVVGAGASGLPAIRHALLYGFDVECYEAQEELGGLWRFNPEETEYSSVMRSTVINTSKEFTAYSDYPPGLYEPNFMHNTRMHNYLQSYARHFELEQHIKFEHKVVNIARTESYSATGQWKVTVENLRSGAISVHIYDCVLHCTGHHAVPHVPRAWPVQDGYRGRIVHAHDYKDWRGYEDKNIVVVGVGNSGCDIAVELSRVAKQVYLVSRRGTWVFNRIHDYGRPVDCRTNRLSEAVKKLIPSSVLNSMVRKKLNERFDHELYGLKPAHDVLEAHPTINDELPNRIANGSILIRPQISRFTQTGIVFDDGTCAENVDTVILSTGYSLQLPEIESGKLIQAVNNKVDLFQYIFPQNLEHDSLAIIGLIQPFGSIIPISEMQVRLALGVLAGEVTLPNRVERKAIMERKSATMKSRYVESRRHTVQVDYLPYMDELAELVGCSPPAWYAHLPYDPSMAALTLTAPHASYFYRLRGPHAWVGANAAISGIEKRITAPTNPHYGKKIVQDSPKQKKISLKKFFLIMSFIAVFLSFTGLSRAVFPS